MRPKGTLDQLYRLHRNAVQAIRSGDLTIKEAVVLYAVSPRSILRWQASYDGIAINRKNGALYQGRKPSLSGEQLLVIKTDLRSSIFRGSQKRDDPAGRLFQNVRRYLSDRYNIHFSRSHIYRIIGKLKKGCF